jgi:predicted transcriptional regulator
MSTTFDKIAYRIIKEQELIIGPIAWQEARRVPGVHIGNSETGEVTVDDDSSAASTINQLVGQYERLFGRASREACREAVAGLIADLAPSEIPSSLLAA